MPAVVTGSTGLLGTYLVPALRLAGHHVVTHGRSGDAELKGEFVDSRSTGVILDGQAPEAIVNLVGLTDVDKCEREPHAAFLGNTRSVENIIGWIQRYQQPCHLVHLSTDQVYDGHGPHSEDDVTLTNYYAFSKYAGELAALRGPSTILRTNFFGRSRIEARTSLTDWLFRSLENADKVDVFDDIAFSPLSMRTLSVMIARTLVVKAVGVFNLGSHHGLTKADFAFAFAEEMGLPTRHMKRTTSGKPNSIRAYRPKDMRMACQKFEHAFEVQLPSLEEEIKLVAGEYREHS